MTKIDSFRDLNMWQLGMEIVEDVYRITNDFPKDEMYGLVSQMRRCAVSLPSNIAEGFSRHHNKEYSQFLYIARGSSSELETQLEIAFRLKYIKNNILKDSIEKLDHFNRMTRNLLKRL